MVALPFDTQKAVLYARLIQAAYAMYDANKTNLTPAPSNDFPAGYELTAWVEMQDFFIFGSTGPVFYGFIAQSIQNANEAVLAIRGTDNDLEWWDDVASLGMQPFRVAGCGDVGMGWEKIYETLEIVERPTLGPASATSPKASLKAAGSFSAQVAEHLRRRAAANPAQAAAAAQTIEVTGHSLGAALATLYAAENALIHKISNPALYTFASPMVGSRDFVKKINALDLTSWRVINEQDVVRILPPGPNYEHINTAKPFSSIGIVGQSIGCCHAIATYLHLLDPSLLLEVDCLPTVPQSVPD
jgi:Lipase (class 3)